MSGSDDDLERMFRLEYSPAEIAPAPVDTWSSPRHSPAEVATDSAPAGAAVAAQLARSRELRGGWRWTSEQKQLKATLRMQRQMGADLDQLTHIGARVLHARRAPDSAQPVDHIVVDARGVFVVADVLSTPDHPVSWHPSGHLATDGISMRLYEESLVGLARDGIGAAERLLGERWRVPVEPVIVVSGGTGGTVAPGTARSGATVCSAAALKHVVHAPLTPALFDPTDVAVIADAVARIFPDAS